VLTVWVRAVGKVRVPSRPTSRAKKVGLQGLPWTRKHITIAVTLAQGGLATCSLLYERTFPARPQDAVLPGSIAPEQGDEDLFDADLPVQIGV